VLARVDAEGDCNPRNLTTSRMPPRIDLEGEKTPARVDDEGRAIKEADGTVAMREAQPMEYSNGVCGFPIQNVWSPETGQEVADGGAAVHPHTAMGCAASPQNLVRLPWPVS